MAIFYLEVSRALQRPVIQWHVLYNTCTCTPWTRSELYFDCLCDLIIAILNLDGLGDICLFIIDYIALFHTKEPVAFIFLQVRGKPIGDSFRLRLGL